MIKRKRIEIFLDAVILLMGLLLLITILSSGFQFTIGDKVIGLRSIRNPLILFLIIFGIRSVIYGKPFSYLPWNLQGAKAIWVILSAVTGLIIIYLVSMNILATSQNKDVRIIDLQHASEFLPASSFDVINGKIRLKSDKQYLYEFQLPAGETSGYSKVRFIFDSDRVRNKHTGIHNLTKLEVLYVNADGEVIKGLSSVRMIKGIHVYDLPLIDKEFDTFHIKLKSTTRRVNSQISGISLHSPHISEYKHFSLVLAVITGLLLLAPGLLIVSILATRNRSNTILLCSMFAASLCYYLVLYGLLELAFLLELSKPGDLLLVGLLLSIAGLLYQNFRQDRFDTLNHYISLAGIPVAIFIVVLLLLTAYISFDTLYPFQNIGYQSISGPKTFAAFNAHDNYFQYANGRVIAENIPFSTEYGGGRLLYMPEDREMLPGVIYAVFRSIYSAVSPYIGNSYMTYTIFGVAMNLMVIFPIIALTRRYVDIKPVIFLIILLFGNAVFIVQPSLAWFKFCGAALFLSAILILLRDRSNLQAWLLAGLLFGLAANMHAAVSIGIPLYFLWFVYQWGRETQFQPTSWLPGPMLLVGVFILVNLPWKLIKKYYLHDSIDLFATFFFAGYKVNGSLLDSAVLFLNKFSLHEQIMLRLQNFMQAFRLEEVFKLPGLLLTAGYEKFFLQWTQHEVGYTVFLYYPLILLLMISFLVNRYLLQLPSMRVTNSGFQGMGRNSELKSLILIGLATQMIFVISAFSFHHQPDVSWSQPYGVTVLVYLGMMLILLQSRYLTGLLIAYVLFAYTRLYLAYQVVPIPG